MKTAGLYAGIGGFELGFEREGYETSVLCEIDAACVEVLQKNFDATVYEDIADMEDLPHVDVLLAGFPCQPYSQAGATRGLSIGRSHIDEIFRLVDNTRRRPHTLVLENVPNLIFLQNGRALGYVLTNLEARGYRWAYRIVDTEAFGLPHRRQRWILVASTQVDPSSVLLGADGGLIERDDAAAFGFYWTEGNTGVGWASDSIPPLKAGSGFSIPSPPAIWNYFERRIEVPSIRDAERLQGFRQNWTLTAETESSRGARGRWRMVGNAVSVPVSRWIARRLQTSRNYRVHGEVLRENQRYPRAAYFDGKTRFAAKVSPYPTQIQCPPILEFLIDDCTPLSFGATRGFRLRYEASGLRKNKQFIRDLKYHEKAVC